MTASFSRMEPPPGVQQRALDRTLKPQWVFALAVGSAVGWGAFVLPTDWLESGGFVGTSLGFLIACVLICIIAFSYGVVIRELPVTGGGVAYALAGTGRAGAFVAGWCLTLGYAGIVALNASAIALVFRLVVPELVMTIPLYQIAGWRVYLPEVIVSIVALVALAWINIRGAELSGRLQYISVVVMLVGVSLVFLGALGSYLLQGKPHLGTFPADASPFAAVTAIVAFAPWAYVGFDNVPQTAGEFKFSPRKALALLLWGIVAATLIYVAMTFSAAVGVQSPSFVVSPDSAWPTATAITAYAGRIGVVTMVVSVSMGVVTGLNGFFISASRVLFALGRAGMIPAAFARIHPTSRTPAFGVVFTALLCLPTTFLGRAALLWIVDMTSVGIAIAYFFTCFCAFRIGSTGIVSGMVQPKKRSPLLAATGIAGCLIAIGFILLLLVPQSPGALSQPALFALVIWFAFGLLFFMIRLPVLLKASRNEVEKAIFEADPI